MAAGSVPSSANAQTAHAAAEGTDHVALLAARPNAGQPFSDAPMTGVVDSAENRAVSSSGAVPASHAGGHVHTAGGRSSGTQPAGAAAATAATAASDVQAAPAIPLPHDSIDAHNLGGSGAKKRPLAAGEEGASGSGYQSKAPQPLILAQPQIAIPRPTAVTSLPTSAPDLSHRTGYVFDERMAEHINENDETHPEQPARILKIYEKLESENLLDRMKRFPARLLLKEEALRYHSEDLWVLMSNLDDLSLEKLTLIGARYDSVYLNKFTGDCAKLSAGGVIEMCNAVWEGQVQNGFAIVRPPGHHAEATEAMGFCIFNNCVIAAQALKDKYGAKKICILDWDVHHGNGIQRAFLSDSDVLYISLHRYEDASFYPHSRDAAADVVGEGAGLGRNVNIPWPCGGMGDPEYIHAFNRIIVPILTEYQPEIIIVAAGFDAAQSDPLGGCLVTPSGYFHMTHTLKRFARGKIVLALEGGYTISAIPECAASCVRALLDDVPPLLDNSAPRREAVETIDEVAMIQGKWWHSVHGGGVRKAELPEGRMTIPMKEILSRWRELVLTQKYRLASPMMSWRPNFSGEVYVSSDILERTQRKRMLFIHEHAVVRYPTRHGGENIMDEEETFLADINLQYLNSIVHADFSVIDVDVKAKFTGDKTLDAPHRRSINEVVLELYDTFLRGDSDVFIIAMGPFAAQAVVNLIKEREVERKVRHIFSVPIPHDRTLPQLDPAVIDAEKIKWYLRHSHVVVRSNVFEAGRVIPLTGDGYGTVVSSGSTEYDLEALMFAIHDEVFEAMNTILANHTKAAAKASSMEAKAAKLAQKQMNKSVA